MRFLDSLLRALNFSETNDCCVLMVPWPRQNAEHRSPESDVFYIRVRNSDRIAADYADYHKLLRNGMTTEQTVIKMKQSKPPFIQLQD